MDAVFADPGGRLRRRRLEDRAPPDRRRRDARPRSSSPRTGWPGPTLAGVPVERVGAAFHYVRDGVTVRPADLLDAAGLAALVTALPTAGDD